MKGIKRIEVEGVMITLPEGWDVDVQALGWSARTHDPTNEMGVEEYGPTRKEAILALKRRMEEWLEK